MINFYIPDHMQKLGSFFKKRKLEDKEPVNLHITKKKKIVMRIPYELSTILAKYQTRFCNFGSKKVIFNSGKKSIRRVEKNSYERELYSSDISPFIVPIKKFPNLIDFEISSHSKIESNFLTHRRLETLKIDGILCLKFSSSFKLRALKSLTIKNSCISFRFLKKCMKSKNLVKLELDDIRFTKAIDSIKLLNAFTNAKSLKYLKIKNCHFESEIYYHLKERLDLNYFEVVTFTKSICIDMTILNTPSFHFDGFDNKFFSCGYSEAKVFEIEGDILDMDLIYKMNITNATMFSIKDVLIDQLFIDFLFKNNKITSISFLGCSISEFVLIEVMKRYRKTLRYFNLSDVRIPLDFIDKCHLILIDCQVIYGPSGLSMRIN